MGGLKAPLAASFHGDGPKHHDQDAKGVGFRSKTSSMQKVHPESIIDILMADDQSGRHSMVIHRRTPPNNSSVIPHKLTHPTRRGFFRGHARRGFSSEPFQAKNLE